MPKLFTHLVKGKTYSIPSLKYLSGSVFVVQFLVMGVRKYLKVENPCHVQLEFSFLFPMNFSNKERRN